MTDKMSDESSPGDAAAAVSEKAGAPSPAPAAATDDHLHGKKLILTLLALMLSVFVVALDMSILATAIPRITTEFRSLSSVGWYASAFFMCLSCFAPVWGKLFRFFNLKSTFLASICLFEVGSLICAVTPTNAGFIVGRGIQGAGGAGIIGGGYTILAMSAPPHKVPALTGIVGFVYSISSVAGPLLGGALTEITWRWCFYVNLPIGGLAVVLLILFYHTPASAKPVTPSFKVIASSLDIPGVLLVLGGLISLSFALQYGGVSRPWDSSVVIGLLVGFGLFVAAFIGTELYQKERALVVPRILKRRTIGVLALFSFLNTSASFARVYNLPIYFQSADGVSPVQSGIRNLAIVLSLSLSSFVGSALVGKVGYYTVFLIVGQAIATVGSGLIYTLNIGSPAREYVGYQIIAGIGNGLCIQVPVIVAQSTSPRPDVSITVGAILFFQFIAGSIGVVASQSIIDNRLIAYLRELLPDVDPSAVVALGAAGLRDVYSGEQLQAILEAYMGAIKDAWLFTLACSGAAFVVCFGAGFNSIKPKKVKEAKESKEAKEAKEQGSKDASKDESKDVLRESPEVGSGIEQSKTEVQDVV